MSLYTDLQFSQIWKELVIMDFIAISLNLRAQSAFLKGLK